MHHEILVGVVDGAANNAEQRQALVQSDAVRVLVDRLAVDELHHHVGDAVAGDAAVEHAGDVRVVEVGENLAEPAFQVRFLHESAGGGEMFHRATIFCFYRTEDR